MKSSKGWLGRMFVLAALFVVAPVWADEPVPDMRAALAAYEKGKDFAKAGEWQKAEEAFKESLKQGPLLKAAGQLGRVQVERRNYIDGARNLEWFFQEDTEVPMEVKEAARPELVLAKRNIATVKLRVDPLEAEVRIDGVVVPAHRVAWPQYLEPGEHTFEAKKQGFVTATDKRKLAAGSEGPVELKLVAEQGVVKEPVKKDEPKQVPVKVNPFLIAGGVVSAALVVTGIGLGIGSKLRNDQAEEAVWAQNKQRYDEEYGASVSLWTGAFISTGIGIAVGAVTLGYTLKGRNASNSKGSTSSSIVVLPTVGGLVMQGAF